MPFIPKDKDPFSHFLADLKNFTEEEEEFKKILDNVKKDIREGKDVNIEKLDKEWEKLKIKIIACASISKVVKGSDLEHDCVKEI